MEEMNLKPCKICQEIPKADCLKTEKFYWQFEPFMDEEEYENALKFHSTFDPYVLEYRCCFVCECGKRVTFNLSTEELIENEIKEVLFSNWEQLQEISNG